ncbi:alcohol dehydrogenase catalytic domain-containing protein [Caulobacter zeae]|uniref:alcohol dehydrogenase catalytic domain-containing protein n=1 Tax=Caulobacter zeae TaxID=2055137 RepID=UPI001F0C9921|nr:alcohol dehydrogenase catalytic domain-containing protein [Caulobacter zeae]
MVLQDGRLSPVLRPPLQAGRGEILVKVRACGVCRTDLPLLDGDLPLGGPIVPGHEVVGEAAGLGDGVDDSSLGSGSASSFRSPCAPCVRAQPWSAAGST